MKVQFILISLFSLLFLVGCGSESSEVFETKSPDGKISITAQGTTSVIPLEPWRVDIKMTMEGKEPIESFVEVYADSLSTDNVKFTWKSEHECLITLTQRDGQKVNVPVKVQGL